MNRQAQLTIWFAVLSVVFFLLLIFLRVPFGLYPLMSVQDAFDILTPLVLIPIYWLMVTAAARRSPTLFEQIAFLVLAGFWVSGHGMHLSANSINNLTEGLAREQEIDITGTSIHQLIYFYDEKLSHYLRDIGIIGLAGLVIWRAWRGSDDEATTWWVAVLSGLLYGFTLFCIFLEGQTVALGLPFVAIAVSMVLWRGRGKLAHSQILAFFFVACLAALVLFIGWALYWGGFPQFSEVGLI